MNKLFIFPVLLVIFLSMSFVCANENITEISINDEIISQDSPVQVISDDIGDCQIEPSQIIEKEDSSIIDYKEIKNYYNDDVNSISYLKDSNKEVLCKKAEAPLKIITADYKTYLHSDLFFKAKVINKVTNDPVKGIKVAFKVLMANNKYKTYYATTNEAGIAKLKKNFDVGSYKVVTSVKNGNIKSKSSRSTLTVKPTKEYGCCSFYVQVSNSEAVTGFRRDGTYSSTIHIIKCKWNGRTALKQYKTDSYFFHTIVTSDGWMVGTGGIDSASINKAIENLAGKMVKSGKITKSTLKKIQRYERILGLGHFSIKAPNGKYGLVWGNAIKTGKLKAGEYLSVPNGMPSFRHSTWNTFSKNPKDAAIRVAATDPYGINRRQITAYHWKATTVEGKTTSLVKAYASNDDGKLLGRSSTAYLKDNIYFGNKFISKNKLPKTPSSKYLGFYKYGNIDKLIKTFTIVSAPKLTKHVNESKTFDITVKNKKTKKPIANIILKIKILKKVYTVKTDSKGIAKFNTKRLGIGSHSLTIYSGNINYYVSAKSRIRII